MSDKSKEFIYTVDDSIDEIFDERGNTVLAIRKVQWGNAKEAKLELRKWYVDIDKETPNKGFSFLTENGPDNLINGLLKHGYGDTIEVLDVLKERADFRAALWATLPRNIFNTENKKENDILVEYYDPKESLLDDIN